LFVAETPCSWSEKCRFIKSNRAEVNAASISFLMCCHSVGCGYGDANAVANAIGYAQHCSRSHDAIIRVYDDAGNVIETHGHKGDFKTVNLFLNFFPMFLEYRF
jgi:hypothetical protein